MWNRTPEIRLVGCGTTYTLRYICCKLYLFLKILKSIFLKARSMYKGIVVQKARKFILLAGTNCGLDFYHNACVLHVFSVDSLRKKVSLQRRYLSLPQFLTKILKERTYCLPYLCNSYHSTKDLIALNHFLFPFHRVKQKQIS